MFSLFRKKAPQPQSAPVFVVPRIKHANFLVAMANIPGMDAESRPLAEPLAGDLLLTYAVDTGPGYEMVSPASVAKYGLDRPRLRTQARQNVLPVMRSIKLQTDGTLYELTANDNMAACTILFAEFWDRVEREQGGKMIAIFPHRDRVVFGRADSLATRPALAKVRDAIDFDETHALSKLLYARSPSGAWQALDA